MRRPLVHSDAQTGFASRSPVWMWLACCAGQYPAEGLDPRDREDLVAGLVERGWTDRQVAKLTRLSTYTAARIRTRIGLPANPAPPVAAPPAPAPVGHHPTRTA